MFIHSVLTYKFFFFSSSSSSSSSSFFFIFTFSFFFSLPPPPPPPPPSSSSSSFPIIYQYRTYIPCKGQSPIGELETMNQNTRQKHKSGPLRICGQQRQLRTEYKRLTPSSRIEIKIPNSTGSRTRASRFEGRDSTDHATATDTISKRFSNFPLPRTTRCRQSTYHGPPTAISLPFKYQKVGLMS